MANTFKLLAALFWIVALAALVWQSYAWFSTGVWPDFKVSVLFVHGFGGIPSLSWSYARAAVAIISELQVAMFGVVGGLFFGALAKLFGD